MLSVVTRGGVRCCDGMTRRQLLWARLGAYAVGGSWSPNSAIMVSRILNFWILPVTV